MAAVKQQLIIGLSAADPAWEALLQQLGLPWTMIAPEAVPAPHDYSVIIVPESDNAARTTAGLSRFQHYLKAGGAVLDCGALAAMIAGEKPRRRHISLLKPAEAPAIFHHIDSFSGGPYRHQVLSGGIFDGAMKMLPVENGACLFWGLNLSKLLFNRRTVLKPFYGPGLQALPEERVSKVNKGALIQLAEAALKWLYFQRGLPFTHLHHFPGTAENIFAFRIDSDYGGQEAIQTWYKLARDYGLTFTWFLHSKAHADWLNNFKSFEQQELAIHCHWHQTEYSAAALRKNIERAADLLRRQGISFSGYAAPYGIWQPAATAILKDLGIQYSSEFSLGYDMLPFYPFYKNHFSDILQVPIHPICIGSLEKAGLSDSEMSNYFSYQLRRKMAAGRPLIFYDHPGHNRLAVVRQFLAAVAELNLPNLSFGEYARWWRKRSEINWQVELYQGQLHVSGPDGETAVQVQIHRQDGHRAMTQFNSSSVLTDLSWQQNRPRPDQGDLPAGPPATSWRQKYRQMLQIYWRFKNRERNQE